MKGLPVLINMLLILTWSIAAHSDPIKVYVRNEAQVALGNITLGAVADIVSTNVDDERQLGALILGESPKPGEKVEWPSAEISRRLRPYGRILQGVTLRVPDKIIVRRVVKGFTREALRKQFEDALKQTLPDSSWEVGLTELNIPDELQIPHDGSVQVVPLQNRPRGAVQFEVDVIEKGRIVQRRYFNGHVAFKAPVAVALRQIDARTHLQSTDMQWVKRDVTFLSDTPATPADLTNAIARSSIVTDTVITRASLEREMALRYGEEVQVIAGDDTFSVSMKAIAQQNGALGDVVRLKNSITQKLLTGTVVAKGVVRVDY